MKTPNFILELPLTDPACAEAGDEGHDPLPAVAELILSALDSGRHHNPAAANRRGAPRVPHRVRARLRLFSEPNGEPRVIYTRDAHARGLGFITPHRLPLGYGGFVEFRGPDGRARRIQCTLHRCREAAPGWFEGSVCFNREQPELVDFA
jgi:hypothetical protein